MNAPHFLRFARALAFVSIGGSATTGLAACASGVSVIDSGTTDTGVTETDSSADAGIDVYSSDHVPIGVVAQEAGNDVQEAATVDAGISTNDASDSMPVGIGPAPDSGD